MPQNCGFMRERSRGRAFEWRRSLQLIRIPLRERERGVGVREARQKWEEGARDGLKPRERNGKRVRG